MASAASDAENFGLRTHLTSLCTELIEVLSGCTRYGGYLAHRRIEIGPMLINFYSIEIYKQEFSFA